MNLDDNELTSLTWLHTINILSPSTNNDTTDKKDKNDAVSNLTFINCGEKQTKNKIRSSAKFRSKRTITKFPSKSNVCLPVNTKIENIFAASSFKIVEHDKVSSEILSCGNAATVERMQEEKEFSKLNKERKTFTLSNLISRSISKPSEVSI